MKPISIRRFNALAGYSRAAMTRLIATEHAWFSYDNERVLGILLEDHTDHEISGICMARDKNGRYRWVCGEGFGGITLPKATSLLRKLMIKVAKLPDSSFEQGDETDISLDLLTPDKTRMKLHPSFQMLVSEAQYEPAREMIKAMAPYFKEVDGTFLRQFQSYAFDNRLWELYWFAVLTEEGFDLDRTYESPDYIANHPLQSIALEAVTANPSTNSKVKQPDSPTTKEEILTYLKEFMPHKFAGPLWDKLKKQYWTKAHVAGKPLLIAIQDFHAPGSMSWSDRALPWYLYGIEFTHSFDDEGNIQLHFKEIQTHPKGETTIPSNFFGFEGAENISAVVYNANATIAKFNRMAVGAGFGTKDLKLIQFGSRFNPDRNSAFPQPFVKEITKHNQERWTEGMNVYHNPNAIHPLNPEVLPHAAHHRIVDRLLVSDIPEIHPFGTRTLNLLPARKTLKDS